MLRCPKDLAVERIFRPPIRRLKWLVLETQINRHAECCCAVAHALPCDTDRQFGKAVAPRHLAPEGGANGLELVRHRTITVGLAPFHRQAALILAALECRTVDPPVLFDFRPWHVTQDMMAARNSVTPRHAGAP